MQGREYRVLEKCGEMQPRTAHLHNACQTALARAASYYLQRLSQTKWDLQQRTLNIGEELLRHRDFSAEGVDMGANPSVII